MAKKKINRGYATVSTAKKVPKEEESVDTVRSLQSGKEIVSAVTADTNADTIADTNADTNADTIAMTNDPDRKLKWQIQYEFKANHQKRLKLEGNELMPDFFLDANQDDLCQFLTDFEDHKFRLLSLYEINKSFLMMEKLGFDRNVIKRSLKNTGGDLNNAIGWACLNVPNVNLPIGFSQTIEKEKTETLHPKVEDVVQDLRRHDVVQKQVQNKVKEQSNDKVDKDLQNRILASLEWSDSSSDENEKKSDMIQDYVSTYIQYIQVMDRVASAKLLGDKMEKKLASKSANRIMQKIISLKSKMDSDHVNHAQERIEEWIKDWESKKAKDNQNNDVEQQENEEDILGIDMLEQTENKSGIPASKTVFIHDLTWKGWSGTAPIYWLSDFLKRNHPNSSYSIHLLPQVNSAHRAKLLLKFGDEKSREFIMDDEDMVSDKNNAKEYVALKALFILSPDSQFKNFIAPPFRNLWDKWAEEGLTNVQTENKVLDADRIDFVNKLLQIKEKEVIFSLLNIRVWNSQWGIWKMLSSTTCLMDPCAQLIFTT